MKRIVLRTGVLFILVKECKTHDMVSRIQASQHPLGFLVRVSVFPVKFQLKGFVPLTTEKWGYKEQNMGTKQSLYEHKKILSYLID